MDSTVERKVKVVESRKESEWGKSRFGKDGGGGGGWKKIRRVRVKTRRERGERRQQVLLRRKRGKKVISFHPFIRIRGKMQVERMNE